MGERMLCIVAGQRAGTTALQSAIASTGLFHNFSEIFQTSEVRRTGSFLDYADARGISIVQMATDAGAQDVLSGYLDSLSMQSGDRMPLVDIKFNSWNAIRSFWTYPTQEPALLQALRQRDAFFLFVGRKDLAAQIISEKIARVTSKWHELDAEDVGGTFQFPLAQARAQAELILDAEHLLLGFLRRTGRVFPIWYEDLYGADGRVCDRLVDWLRSHLSDQLPPALFPGIRKNRVCKASVVENFEDVAAMVAQVIRGKGRVCF